MKILFFILIIVISIYKLPVKEGLFAPDETQYIVCTDKSSQTSDFIPEENPIFTEKKGSLSSLLSDDKQNLPDYHKAPHCGSAFMGEEYKYFNDNVVVDHKNNKWTPPVDPYDPHPPPDYENSILYPEKIRDEIHKGFQKAHDKNKEEILLRKV